MPSTRAQAHAQAHAQKYPQHDTHPAAANSTMAAELSIWCLAELEKAGDMHPDAYAHAPQPKGPKESHPRKRKDSIQDSASSFSSPPPPAKPFKRSPNASGNKMSHNSASQGKDSRSAPAQTLRFLLSPHVLPLTVPAAEAEAASHDSGTRIYATARLTPFEELLSAVILSRPASHALGQRAIRVALNEPYALTTPQAVLEAGQTGREEALWAARTQHKEKTAAETVAERWRDLEGVREEADRKWEREREVLRGAVKGLGEVELDIFGRRVQWLWEEVFPFVDGRTRGALEALGLPGEARELRELMKREWEALGVKDIGLKDEEAKRRRAFVVVLERAVGASLEKRVQDVVREAMRE